MTLNPAFGDSPWDPQAKVVYSWERSFIERRVGPQMMSRDECEGMVRSASVHLGMSQPRIVYLQMPGEPCLASPREHAIKIAEWGRGQVTLLHEMAHLATWRAFMRGEAPHGPSFVSMAIRLYERYLGIPAAWQEEKARMRGIDFVPALRPGLAVPPPSGDLFDGDF